MRKKLLFPVILVLCLICTMGKAQQPTLEWAKTFNNPNSQFDIAVAVDVDAAGNSYVTGTSRSSGVLNKTITTIKYSPTGEQLWVKQLDGTAVAIAVDNSGGIYVIGESNSENYNSDYVTIRYDAVTGEQNWMQQYKGPADEDERAHAIAVDNSGSVYVTGYSIGEGYNSDYVTIRYEATTGQLIWVSRYDSAYEFEEYASAIAVDNNGGVYVTGSSITADYVAYTTVRFDAATGEETWAQQTGAYYIVTDIAVDNNGGVYVTGYTCCDYYDDPSGSESDSKYATIRYDAATGQETWIKHYDGSIDGEDQASAIAVDNSGGIYVTGTSAVNFYNKVGLATVRYDATTGEQTWVQRYEGIDGFEYAGASDIEVDNQGNVYVAGYAGDCIQCQEFLTIRYDADSGQEVWVEDYSQTEDNQAVDMAVDGMGNIIIAGHGNTTFASELGGEAVSFITIKYSQERQCVEVEETLITGYATVSSGFNGAGYYLDGTGASTFTWSITAPDGSPYTAFTGQGTSAIEVDWPSKPDVYKVSVSYSSGEGCSTQTAVKYVHVYDTAAGFITGGGWMESPANSAFELMQTGRRAHLSLMVRYSKREDKQVQGSTSLLLQAGYFTFRSTSYNPGSLVITGNRAYYSGTGTLTHRDSPGRSEIDNRLFGFAVAATDGQFGQSSEPDRFRLRIWVINEDGTQGEVVYDNQIGCSSPNMDDNAEACTAIAGGNIRIHKLNARRVASKNSYIEAADVTTQGLQVYPTAVTDRAKMSFVLEGGGAYVLEVYDVKGALVRKLASGTAQAGRLYKQEFSVENMSNGLYLTRLTTATGIQIVKLVVQR